MTDRDHVIAHEEEPRPSGVPVFAQLALLGLILIALFGSLAVSTLTGTGAGPSGSISAGTDAANSRPLPPPADTTIDEVELTAASANVWDVSRQRALYTKDPNAVRPLASITKLMTTLVAYELVADEETVSIPYRGILQEGSSGLSTGEEFTARALADLALISSSNDAAYSLAAAVGGELGDRNDTAQFVAAMNIRAEELGLTTLEFHNPTGLDRSPREAGAYGSAREVSFLMEYILTHYPDLLAATTRTDERIYSEDGRYHDAANTNDLVSNIPNLLGSKTGFTDLAGGNLTVAFDAGFNRPIVVTVLGSTRSGRFADVEQLVAAATAAIAAERE